MKQYFVYIMSNKSRRLYVGITGNCFKRILQHKYKLLPGFTARYNFDMLVYYEEYSQVASAFWPREKKLKLILAENPDWADWSKEWKEDPSWKALSEVELRTKLKRKAPQD